MDLESKFFVLQASTFKNRLEKFISFPNSINYFNYFLTSFFLTEDKMRSDKILFVCLVYRFKDSLKYFKDILVCLFDVKVVNWKLIDLMWEL